MSVQWLVPCLCPLRPRLTYLWTTKSLATTTLRWVAWVPDHNGSWNLTHVNYIVNCCQLKGGVLVLIMVCRSMCTYVYQCVLQICVYVRVVWQSPEMLMVRDLISHILLICPNVLCACILIFMCMYPNVLCTYVLMFVCLCLNILCTYVLMCVCMS